MLNKLRSNAPFVEYQSDGFLKDIDRRHGFLLTEEFPGALMPGTLGWAQNGSGIEAANQASNTGEEASGIVYVGAAAAGTHRSSYLTFNSVPVDRGITHLEFYFRNLGLFDATEDGRMFMGLIDNVASATLQPTDGVWLEYDRANNGDFYSFNTAQGGTITEYVADGGGGRNTAAVVAGVNTFNRFTMITDPQNDSAKFFINGVLITEITTNLPKTDGQNSNPGWMVQKTADAAAVNKVTYVDYVKYGFIYNNPRA